MTIKNDRVWLHDTDQQGVGQRQGWSGIGESWGDTYDNQENEEVGEVDEDENGIVIRPLLGEVDEDENEIVIRPLFCFSLNVIWFSNLYMNACWLLLVNVSA